MEFESTGLMLIVLIGIGVLRVLFGLFNKLVEELDFNYNIGAMHWSLIAILIVVVGMIFRPMEPSYIYAIPVTIVPTLLFLSIAYQYGADITTDLDRANGDNIYYGTSPFFGSDYNQEGYVRSGTYKELIYGGIIILGIVYFMYLLHKI